MNFYNPNDWYWRADDGRIFSSARGANVSLDDTTFLLWSESFVPTRWPEDDHGEQTLASLQNVLSPYGLFCDLNAYANAKQWEIATGGRALTVAGQEITFSTSEASLSLIAGKVTRLQQPNPPATVRWQTGDTTFLDIAASDFVVAAASIADFVQATFDALPGIFAGISSGAITQRDQIDTVLTTI